MSKLLLPILMILPGLTSFASASDVSLRLHHFLATTSPVHAYLASWAERIEAESDGRIAIEIYPSMQLGGAPASLVDQVIDGVADLVWTLPGYTAGRFPATEAFELPFMTGSAETGSQALCRYFDEHLRDEYAEMHVLLLHTSGPGLFHLRGEPIRTLDELEGRTIRGPSRVTTDALALLGAEPVGMPVPQVPESLARGVIDGALLPWEVTASLRIPELVDSHTAFATDHGFYASTFLLAMNLDRYEALPEDLRAVIDRNSMTQGCDEAALVGRALDAADRDARELALDEGNEIHTISVEDAQAWIDALAPVREAWTERMDALGLDGRRLLERAIELVEVYEAP